MRPGGATRRPFTVIFCATCGSELESVVVQALRESVRSCRHGMLVRAQCLSGPLGCAAHSRTPGVMLVLQPCLIDRSPSAPPCWVGPVSGQGDARIVREWIERGEWNSADLPEALRVELSVAALARRN